MPRPPRLPDPEVVCILTRQQGPQWGLKSHLQDSMWLESCCYKLLGRVISPRHAHSCSQTDSELADLANFRAFALLSKV